MHLKFLLGTYYVSGPGLDSGDSEGNRLNTFLPSWSLQSTGGKQTDGSSHIIKCHHSRQLQ